MGLKFFRFWSYKEDKRLDHQFGVHKSGRKSSYRGFEPLHVQRGRPNKGIRAPSEKGFICTPFLHKSKLGMYIIYMMSTNRWSLSCLFPGSKSHVLAIWFKEIKVEQWSFQNHQVQVGPAHEPRLSLRYSEGFIYFIHGGGTIIIFFLLLLF